jgi:copper(I)-binding protein
MTGPAHEPADSLATLSIVPPVSQPRERTVIRSIRRVLRRRALAAAAAAALAGLLAGCEAGANAPSLHWHYPTDGGGTEVHGLSIRNVFVLGAPIGHVLAAGGSAGLFFAIVNTGQPDRLLSVSAPGAAKNVILTGGSIRLGVPSTLYFNGPHARAVLTGLTRRLTGGSSIRIVLSFQRAGNVTLQVPVMPRAQYYSTFSPPAPTPTASKHHAKAASTTTPSPST